jgi:hypothetical protein
MESFFKVAIILVTSCYMLLSLKYNLAPFTVRREVDLMKRPFLNIYDNEDRKLNVIFITHPFTRPETITEYRAALAAGCHFIGMSSYCEYPAIITNPHDILSDPAGDAWKWDYYSMVRGWCHCFRNPDRFISGKLPLALISESDFANYEQHKPSSIPLGEREYDFVYICLKDNDKCEDGWQAYNRNWEQAKTFIDIMCDTYKLRGLLIGRINCEIPAACHKLMTLTDFQEYAEFIKNYGKCKFIFVPNTCDASPRVITEAMCFNLPILVNADILGGWKYVASETGAEFTSANFNTILPQFLSKLEQYRPREWFMNNYGIHNSGARLLDFIRGCIPQSDLNIDLTSITWLKPGI